MTRSYITKSRRHGEDKFGKFRVTGGPCTNCGQGDNICIHYLIRDGAYVNLPGGIKPSDTTLQPAGTQIGDTYLGVNCGCYAKFHRQVAHIETTQKLRR